MLTKRRLRAILITIELYINHPSWTAEKKLELIRDELNQIKCL